MVHKSRNGLCVDVVGTLRHDQLDRIDEVLVLWDLGFKDGGERDDYLFCNGGRYRSEHGLQC